MGTGPPIDLRHTIGNGPYGSGRQALDGTCGSGGGGPSLPPATQIGQVLYSVDGANFTPQLPLTSCDGWLVNDEGILLVVG